MHTVKTRIDPRVVACGLLSMTVWISTTASLPGAVLWAAGLIAVLVPARHGAKDRMVLPRHWFLWLVLSATLTMLMYLLFAPAHGDVLYQLGVLRATESGLLAGARMGLRLVALVFLAALAAVLSAPLSLAAGLTRVLLPLRRCRVPVETAFYFAFFLLRMFPLLVRESRLIRLAQQSRGIRFGGSWRDRVHSLPALIVPVFAAGMRRGDQLALALAARGFDTRRVPAVVTALRFHAIDWLLAGLLLVGWSLWVWSRIH